MRFIADGGENAKSSVESGKSLSPKLTSQNLKKSETVSNEYSPLQETSPKVYSSGVTSNPSGEDESDFFVVIQSEIEKINKFFVG